MTANAKNLATVKSALTGTTAHVFYTVELGDSVEKWPVAPVRTQEQMDTLDSLSDGRFLVWANDVLAAST